MKRSDVYTRPEKSQILPPSLEPRLVCELLYVGYKIRVSTLNGDIAYIFDPLYLVVLLQDFGID